MVMGLKVKDVKTNEVFMIRASEDRAYIETKDGVKVRLHPIVIRTMIKKGQKFDGHTITGKRLMEKV